MSPCLIDLHSGMGSRAEPTHLPKHCLPSISPFCIDFHSEGMGSIAKPARLPKPSFQSKDLIFFSIPAKISPFRVDPHSGMAEWDSLPKDILVLIAEHFDFFEDFFNFFLVCKSWQSVSSMCRNHSRTLPPRSPWVMLTDIAETNFPKVTRNMHRFHMLVEEVEKNEHIEGMNKRQFFSFSTSKTYEFELPEATRKKCLGVGHGWLITVGYDLQINLLHPFSRQQVGMPPLLSFKDQYEYHEEYKPQTVVSMFVSKAVMSSNPYNSSSIVLAIYGQFRLLAFARPGDKDWTDIYPRIQCYRDVVYYKEKFYAIDLGGVIVVCDIEDVKRPKATPIARVPKGLRDHDSMYLVESSGSLLVVVRFRKGPCYDSHSIIEYHDDIDGVDDIGDVINNIKYDVVDDIEDDEERLHYTVGFSILKLEECKGDMNIDEYPYTSGEDRDDSIVADSSFSYPYKLVPVNNLGDKSLFLGNNASVSLPCSNNVEANHIYFSDDESGSQPCGDGPDTGMYDVKSGAITFHCASEFTSHLTPPMWYI